nr:RNA-directed DNA polymerase, eukaryota [Tanacetum cinerariifolium]
MRYVTYFAARGKISRLSLEQQADLERNVSNEEIKSAVRDYGTNKSPGPDGFTFELFHRYWKLLEQDIVAVVKEFLASCAFPPGCLFSGIPVHSSLTLPHLFFADDAIFFGKWDSLNIRTIVNITVVEKINHASMVGTFRRPPRGGAEEEQLVFILSRMDGLILINILDCWVWSLEATSERDIGRCLICEVVVNLAL